MVAPFLLHLAYAAERCRASTLAHAASMFRTTSALPPSASTRARSGYRRHVPPSATASSDSRMACASLACA
eukprot:3816070-Prymnesium_polylepis.1